jgi:polysaccharide chain length determinant protein (PEP-CTERM system associated)
MEELLAQLTSLLRGIWKYRWQAMTVAWVVVVVGWVTVYKLPDDYKASARVYVDTQSILKPILAGMTSIQNVEQQVSIMSRTLLSRPNIERVIRMVDLDVKASTLKDKEEIINELMKQIKIAGTSSNDIYTITYNDADPKLAKNVVQSLLTIFIEGSLGDKKQDSDKAIRFIDDQIKQYEQKLVNAENAMKEFKQRNSSVLVGKDGSYSAKLEESIELLNQAKLGLAEAEHARNAIKSEIAREEPNAEGAVAKASPTAANLELDARLQTMNKNLDSLRLQFTDQHPDVVSTKRLIEQLEARKKEEASKPSIDGQVGKSYGPVMQQLKVALSGAEAKVASMRARVEEYSARHGRLKALSAAVPELEAQMAQLNRDYEINKTNYGKLLASRESAKLSGNLTTTTEIMTFRIIDPPTVPVKPAGPNRPLLFSAVFVAALLIGTGVALLISQARPTFLSHAQLREITGLPVLGSVSMNWTQQETMRRRRSLLAFSCSFAGMIVLFSGALSFMLLKL